MKILHVYKDYYPILGGIENHIKTLAEAQTAVNHHVTILVTNPGGQLDYQQINGVHVWRVSRLATIASTPLSLSLPLKLRQLQPDITHLHFPYPIGEVSQWLLGRKRPYVITYHSDIVKQQTILRFYRPLMQKVLHNAARILPTSQNYIQSSDALRPLAAKCTVVPLSVQTSLFANVTPLIPPTTLPTLLFIGRHRYYKGIGDLIQAMTHLQARLLIGGDGPMRAEWQQLAQTLGVSNRVQFVGQVSDEELPRLYASADIFILPANARSEAFGKVLLEAMAAGLPCITTEVGTGTSFVVQNGISGLVVPPRQPEQLAQAIQTLLADPDLRQRMGQAGRKRVQHEFTVEKMVARVTAVYESIINNQ
ncbi:MAG: glycosyltransferase [Ardenticatenaceae bacterium]|nr:glycosyltransferase [Ardenticatenaceae bacterium]